MTRRLACPSCRAIFLFGVVSMSASCSSWVCRASLALSSLARWALDRASVTRGPFLGVRLFIPFTGFAFAAGKLLFVAFDTMMAFFFPLHHRDPFRDPVMHSCNTSHCSSSGPVGSSLYACVGSLTSAKEARRTASRLRSAESREAGGCLPVKAGGCVLRKAGCHVPKCMRTLLPASEKRGRWLLENEGRCSLNAL
jgi:hypothetical protein